MKTFWLTLLFFVTIGATTASAHKSSDSYLTIKVGGNSVSGQWDIALRDLDDAFGLDDKHDGHLTWAEVESHAQEIADFALAGLKLQSGASACDVTVQDQLIDQHSDGGYIVLNLAGSCPAGTADLEITYSLLFDIDPQHRGLLNFVRDGQTTTYAFAPEHAFLKTAVGSRHRGAAFLSYVREGIWHIWTGYDHILFLLALLLPSVLQRTNSGWKPALSFRESLINVLKTVTAFTVAHSITLSCATLGIIALPSRPIESLIAASVVIAALNNVIPIFRDRPWPVAFGFGLIHGLGFANVLFELGLPRDALYSALVGFNLGVETGQLAIVSVFLPIAYLLRPSWIYSRIVLKGGSACIVVLATAWLVERAFDVNIIS